MYNFVNLDEAQRHQRREYLDFYGFLAQLSVIVPLLVLQLYYAITWIQQKQSSIGGVDTPSSPARKFANSGSARGLKTNLRRAIWWSGDNVELLSWHLGTKGELVFGGVWLAWLLLLCFLQTGNDYMHLTKRFGIVGASQLPFHYLLAVKTPYSPLQYLTHASHETLNSTHQLLGRFITFLFYLHVAFYLNFFVLASMLEKLLQANIICGLLAALFFTLIGTSALAPVRQWSYRIFLAIHVALSIVILPILYFHVHHIRIYIYETLAILLLNLVLRGITGKTHKDASLTLLPETNLVQISVPVKSKSIAGRWQPGQHAYISLPGQSIKSSVAKNPFTLASLPAIDNQLRFVARIQSGNTAALSSAASASKSTQSISIEGPYGVATHSNTLLSYDRVLLIAGGVGGTFIAPIYRQLLTDLSPSTGSRRRQKISAIWVARSLADVTWAVPSDEREKAGFTERLCVFLTGANDGNKVNGDVEIFDDSKLEEVDEQGIEMEERANLLSKSAQSTIDSSGLRVWNGRPDFARILEKAFSSDHDAAARVAVVVCGPKALGQAVRSEVGRWVHRGRDVFFWNESFAL